MFTSISKRNPSGFTIIELLVVVSIITILITLLLPSLASSRTLTRLLMCSNNLRGIALASAGYSTDNGQWTVHGAEAYYYAPSGYGYRFYNTQIFDDDWGDGKPGTPGSYNLSTNGAQNICGVGQLMWDYHLAERPELILCPQTDYREPTIFTPAGSASNYTFKMMKDKMNQYFTTNFDPVTPTGNQYWRTEYYTGGASYVYWASTYTTRGPLYRLESASPKLAVFMDQEGAGQSIVPSVPIHMSPVPYGWGRIHTEGFNTVYFDGSVSLFRDPDRTITYSDGNADYYGNGWALQDGVYDKK